MTRLREDEWIWSEKLRWRSMVEKEEEEEGEGFKRQGTAPQSTIHFGRYNR
jgi:hypothetical protein